MLRATTGNLDLVLCANHAVRPHQLLVFKRNNFLTRNDFAAASCSAIARRLQCCAGCSCIFSAS
jgi:hypothetical protein